MNDVTAATTFDAAFEQLIDIEKGYTEDNGGPTKYGISQRAYPSFTTDQIKNMQLSTAKGLYKRDYWDEGRVELMPDLIKYEYFDTCVNCGPRTARRMVQKAAGLSPSAQDGIIGPQSLQAINAMNPWRLLVRLLGARIRYYTSLNDRLWDEAGKGWMNRLAHNAERI